MTDPATTPPICDYEGSQYQKDFWEDGGRAYEDAVEAIALKRLLPRAGGILLEVGAGAGRNTPRYHGYERIVLLDYSLTQLQQAKQNLGTSDRYIYVAASVYQLPFDQAVFDASTMIRVLHHLVDGPLAFSEISRVLKPNAPFILEYANKQNIKAIFRWLFMRQTWNPFGRQPVEFVKLNFNFHPRTTRDWLGKAGLQVRKHLTVSHFRMGFMKRLFPLNLLVTLDSWAQKTGDWWQLSPSVFVLTMKQPTNVLQSETLFSCPQCREHRLEITENLVVCTNCRRQYPIQDGIYDFRIT